MAFFDYTLSISVLRTKNFNNLEDLYWELGSDHDKYLIPCIKSPGKWLFFGLKHTLLGTKLLV
jgi:hypothetical protein